MENIEKAAQTIISTPDVEKTTENAGANEVADISKQNEAQFTDGNADNADNSQKQKNGGEEKTKDAKENNDEKPQKSNADYARERRKTEQEKAIRKSKYDAIIDTLNGVNPYTLDKIEDEADVEEYLTMKEIEKSGKDPVADYSRFVKAKTKEQNKQTEETSNREEWVQKDRENFVSKHPDVNLDSLVDDEMFKVFALGKVGKMSMDKIYNDYMSFSSKAEEHARDRAAQLLANNAATPGKLSNQPQNNVSISDMSSKEFEKMIEKAKRGELKI